MIYRSIYVPKILAASDSHEKNFGLPRKSNITIYTAAISYALDFMQEMDSKFLRRRKYPSGKCRYPNAYNLFILQSFYNK